MDRHRHLGHSEVKGIKRVPSPAASIIADVFFNTYPKYLNQSAVASFIPAGVHTGAADQ